MIIKQKESITGDLLDDIILRGVEDIDFHINPKIQNNIKASILDSKSDLFEKAYQLILKHAKDSSIAIVLDDDMDGYTSSALLYQFLKEIGIDSDVIIGEGKTHGLTDYVMNEVAEYDFVIIPDAGSNDIERHTELLQDGKDFLVLDHHQVEDASLERLNHSDRGIVINNQLININKEYTGVGMAFIFAKYINEKSGNRIDVDKYLDLLAIGETGDVANTADKEIRAYTVKGLQSINNLLIKAVMKRKSLPVLTGRDASFSIISLINAATRVGTKEEKEDIFNALVSTDETTYQVDVKKKNKKTGKFDKIPTQMTQHDVVAKQLETIKSRQDRLVKKSMNEVEYVSNSNIVFGLMDDGVNSSITGIIAMKIMDKTNSPTMIGKKYDGFYAGSARSKHNLKKELLDTGLFEFVQGHNQAFGWKIKEENIVKFQNYIKNRVDSNKNKVYYVDKVYDRPTDNDIYMIERNKDVFGGKVMYPTLAYKNIKFNKECINIKGSMTTFFDNGVSCVLFNSPEEIKDIIESNMENNQITMDIVGSPRINKFGNKEIPQIIIEQYEFVDNCDVIEEDMVNIWGIDF